MRKLEKFDFLTLTQKMKFLKIHLSPVLCLFFYLINFCQGKSYYIFWSEIPEDMINESIFLKEFNSNNYHERISLPGFVDFASISKIYLSMEREKTLNDIIEKKEKENVLLSFLTGLDFLANEKLMQESMDIILKNFIQYGNRNPFPNNQESFNETIQFINGHHRQLTLDRSYFSDKFDSVIFERFCFLIKNLHLQKLDMGGLSEDSLTASIFIESMKHLGPKLQSIDLSNNNIGPQGVAALVPALKGITQLQEINLSRNSFGLPEVAALVPALTEMTQLQSINLSSNLIGLPEVAALVPALTEMTQLQEINLSSNLLKGVKALVPALTKMTQLKSINLSYNFIGLQGVKALVPALTEMTQLQEINLSGNRIVREDAEELVPALKGMQLFRW